MWAVYGKSKKKEGIELKKKEVEEGGWELRRESQAENWMGPMLGNDRRRAIDVYWKAVRFL